jgi:outer membrane protein assembly factor BamA
MRIFRSTWIVLLLLCAASCSTTDHLPDGEVLYTGVHQIAYMGTGQKPKRIKNDSTGVIRSIADAAERVDQLLKGSINAKNNAVATVADSDLTKEQKAARQRERKADEENLAAAAEQVNAVLEYAPNNALFGSAYHRFPVPLGLWAYNAYTDKKSGFAKWMYKSFASEPVLISTVNPDTRVKVAANTLHNFGYFHGNVKYVIEQRHNRRKARMNYFVTPGKVFRLDTIAYKGFPPEADSLIRATARETKLHKGAAFNVSNLTAEQSRLESLFRNAGYYYYKSNFATYKADTFAIPYKVKLLMQPNDKLPGLVRRRWYMGSTIINCYRNNEETLPNSVQRRSLTFNYNGRKMPLRPIVWLRNIAHRPRTLYRQTDQEATQNMLSQLGLFSQLNVNYVPRDTTKTCDTLDLVIDGVLDKPYTFDYEMNVTEKNSDRIGPGMTLSLQKKNAFRGGEAVNFKLYGSYEWRTNGEHVRHDAFFNSYEVGTQLSFDFPFIVLPGINRRTFRFPTSTKFSLSADWLNRSGYFNLFTSNLDATYTWKSRKTVKHEFTPFSLTYDKLINSTHEFDSIMQANPSLYSSMRNRFVPAMQYTFTYASAETHRNPMWWQVILKEAGNVTSGIYALTGKKFSEKNKQLFNNPFAQYVKLETELHNTFKLNRTYKLVTRLVGGIIYSYGNTDVAPYSDQFFVGGANSVRAFTIRTIGPGRYYTPRTKYSYMDQTGDLKLEANAELRFPLFGSLNGAAFVDAGNVWLLRKNEMRPGGEFKAGRMLKDLALGTGVGLRYDMSFLVLRLDLGVAIHDPADNHRSGYYNIGKFKDGLTLHFAIGYPF